MSDKTTLIFTGDSFITRQLPKDGYDGFGEISDIIKAHDVAFTSIETTVHDNKGYAEAVSGGTWAMAKPEVLDSLKDYGINLINTATNHSMDFGHGGLLATIENLKERDITFAGTGENLYEASKPAYVETKNARIAMIGVSSSFSPNSPAGAQRADFKGRPGLNPLRFKTVYNVCHEHFEALKKVATATGMNAALERSIKNGFTPPLKDDELPFAGLNFKLSDKNGAITSPDTKDVQRIIASIEEARRQADFVIVSFHSHESRDGDSTKTPLFAEEFARICIDNGADIIAGHGPHELRGVEVYKGKPIFYSLGNFIFQNETVEYQPSDAYEKLGMTDNDTVGAYMDKRSKNGTSGFAVQPLIWTSVMASLTVENGEITQIKLHPIDLHMEKSRGQKGFPTLKRDNEILKYLGELSKPYGTRFEISGTEAVIELR